MGYVTQGPPEVLEVVQCSRTRAPLEPDGPAFSADPSVFLWVLPRGFLSPFATLGLSCAWQDIRALGDPSGV